MSETEQTTPKPGDLIEDFQGMRGLPVGTFVEFREANYKDRYLPEMLFIRVGGVIPDEGGDEIWAQGGGHRFLTLKEIESMLSYTLVAGKPVKFPAVLVRYGTGRLRG